MDASQLLDEIKDGESKTFTNPNNGKVFKVFLTDAFSRGDSTLPLAIWNDGDATPDRVMHLEEDRAEAWISRLELNA